jgi:hypothetical protein
VTRILLLHPEDDLYSGRLAHQHWDRIVDLGFAGLPTYERWSRDLRCPVHPLPGPGPREFERLRDLFSHGMGQMVDDRGLDWWEPLALGFYENILKIYSLERFVSQCSGTEELFVSRAGFYSEVLRRLTPGAVRTLSRRLSPTDALGRRLAQLWRLQPQQILEILLDKYDGDYRLRGLSSRGKKPGKDPVVLLPTAYGNASRTMLAYASSLSDLRFLLVATRQSGWVENPPSNIQVARLGSYAVKGNRRKELNRLLVSFQGLLHHFFHRPEFAILAATGALDFVPRVLSNGLSIRDAWEQVFESESVLSVFCADEKNEYTRIPILLARQRGLPTTSCHHGALDGRYLFSNITADRFLVKGRMEWDYLVHHCSTPEEKIAIAAPHRTPGVPPAEPRKTIVFFSEPYEVFGYRVSEIYHDVLPALASTAQALECSLTIKLHPFESLRERVRLARRVVPAELQSRIQFQAGALRQQLLQRTQFAVTVSSTAAVDCALQEIPVFLCMWLENHGLRYAEQFVKFGAARPLYGAQQIAQIPTMLKNAGQIPSQDLWQPREAETLREWLTTTFAGCCSI